MSGLQGGSPYLSVSECDDLCPALRDTVDPFISGSHEAYIKQVEKYNQNSDVLETANILKSCNDKKLTPQDKQDALSALVGQAICECACGACVWAVVSGVSSGHWEVGGGALFPLHPGPSPGTWEQKDPHE